MSIWSWLFPAKAAPVAPVPPVVPSKPVLVLVPKPVPPVAHPTPPILLPAPKPQVDVYYAYRPLFNLFGKSEGTDKGRGYNETLGYGAYTGGDVNLIGMNLAQIDALQTRMLNHPKNHMNSSAAGRYQVVRTTMRKIKADKAHPLADNLLYNEGMQDYMCLYLLQGRGLSKYLDGKLSEDQFLTNLAKEWASIPKPDGKGYYGNQSHTPVTPQYVRNVLAEVKKRIKE